MHTVIATKNTEDYLVQSLHFTNEEIAPKKGRDFPEVTQLRSKADAGTQASCLPVSLFCPPTQSEVG